MLAATLVTPSWRARSRGHALVGLGGIDVGTGGQGDLGFEPAEPDESDMSGVTVAW